MKLEECVGYKDLVERVKRDASRSGCFNPNGCDNPERRFKRVGCDHLYCDKFAWIIARAKHYAEKTGVEASELLDRWMEDCTYWYMNYFQDCNQPMISGDRVRVFETLDDLKKSIGDQGFRCPSCGKVSKSPYECDACHWKSYGLLKTCGKGVSVFMKSELKCNEIFMPLAWEPPTEEVKECPRESPSTQA